MLLGGNKNTFYVNDAIYTLKRRDVRGREYTCIIYLDAWRLGRYYEGAFRETAGRGGLG